MLIQSKIKAYPLCLENISKDFTTNNMKKKREKNSIEWIYLRFFVDYNNVGLNNIINFHKYLMKKSDI